MVTAQIVRPTQGEALVAGAEYAASWILSDAFMSGFDFDSTTTSEDIGRIADKWANSFLKDFCPDSERRTMTWTWITLGITVTTITSGRLLIDLQKAAEEFERMSHADHARMKADVLKRAAEGKAKPVGASIQRMLL